MTHLDLRDMRFPDFQDYLADAVADPRKARVVLEEAGRAPLFERFEGSERHLLGELYTDVFTNHAQTL